jgi:hypothetical protein
MNMLVSFWSGNSPENRFHQSKDDPSVFVLLFADLPRFVLPDVAFCRRAARFHFVSLSMTEIPLVA